MEVTSQATSTEKESSRLHKEVRCGMNDVKDITATGNAQQVIQADSLKNIKEESRKASSAELSKKDSAVSVDVDNSESEHSDSIASLNDIINVTNIAVKATDEIESYVKSLSGLVEQAETPGQFPRINLLENEANQLVDAIRTTANSANYNGTRPLAGDTISSDVKDPLGEALKFILPDTAASSFGLGQINFSTRDFIVNTRAAVENARAQLDELRKSLDDAVSNVRETTTAVDVATQNSEASQSTVRDVETALNLIGRTRDLIGENPDEALGCVGNLDHPAGKAAKLLNQDS